MSVALIGLYLIYIVGVFEDFLARTTCVVFSSLLHYCMLVYVGWIGLEATYLFMESLRSKERTPKTSSQQRLRNRLFLLSCAVVWGRYIYLYSIIIIIIIGDYIINYYIEFILTSLCYLDWMSVLAVRVGMMCYSFLDNVHAAISSILN